ncbi:MAG: hypothetical protein L3J41_16985, partial [Melioribacteraceae bacterium]|nr:hypothetical protein [Melioribacteraceae bacterium]
MRKLILIAIASVFLFFLSCSKNTPTEPINNAPVIKSITANLTNMRINETTSISCIATDSDGDELTYLWFSNDGTFPNGSSGPTVNWKAPNVDGKHVIVVTVSDVKEVIKDSIEMTVNSDNAILGTVYKTNTNIVIPNALVEISGKSTITSEEGFYRIENIPSGEAVIKVTLTDYEVYEDTLSIIPDKTTEYDIYLIGSIMFTGHVADVETQAGIKDVKITIDGREDSTDSNGYYEFFNFTPGTYTITTKKENYFLFEGQVYLSSSDKTFDIAMEYMYTDLSGVVKDSYTGELLKDVKVSIDGKEDITDQNGYYEFYGLDKGIYNITANNEYYKYPIYNEQITLDNRNMTYNILLLNTCEGTTTVSYSGKTYNT